MLITTTTVGQVAGILIEPIQGEGGDRHFRPAFLKRLRELADRHEALLIFDEVQTGCWRTGPALAHQAYGIEADIEVIDGASVARYRPVYETLAGGG